MRGTPLFVEGGYMQGDPHYGSGTGALSRPPGTRFLCKKPVPEPSCKNSNIASGASRLMQALRGRYSNSGSGRPLRPSY